MADNYLERKMEEYRSRKAGVASHIRRKGVLTFGFPERRVLLMLSCSRLCDHLVNLFLPTGSRVAVMGHSDLSDAASGARFYDTGVTGYDIAIDNLLEAWRDIDVIVTDMEIPPVIIDRLLAARECLPYPNPYGGRFITLGENHVSIPRREHLSEAGFTINRVTSGNSAALARMCAFLAVPENSVIDGRDILI